MKQLLEIHSVMKNICQTGVATIKAAHTYTNYCAQDLITTENTSEVNKQTCYSQVDVKNDDVIHQVLSVAVPTAPLISYVITYTSQNFSKNQEYYGV